MNFKCINCNYSTHDKYNYDRHLSTKKHQEKVNKTPNHSCNNLTTITHHSSENDFKCLFCNNSYSNSSNLARHKNACIEKQKFTDEFNNKLKEIEIQNKILQNELGNKNELLKSKDVTIQNLQSENRNLRTLLNNAGSVIKTSVSTFSYIVTNYNEAPALEHIKDLPKLHYELSATEFVEQIICEYRHETLTSYIGDMILKQCKKEDPKQQSIWNSDTSRLTYIIREIMYSKNLDWRVDKKGIKTTKFLLEPVLDYIGECLEKYLQKSKIGKRSDSTNKLVDTMHNFHDVNKIIQLIDDKILEDDLLKYLAPHLYLVKNGELLGE